MAASGTVSIEARPSRRGGRRSGLDLCYGVATHGADTAGAYVRNIEAVMDRLLVHPALGAARDLRPGLRSIAAGEHRIYYRIEGEAIIVARVLHKAMNMERWI